MLLHLSPEGTPMTYLFIQGNQSHTSGPNGKVTRVVIHATVSPCKIGGARGNAKYFQSSGAGGLAHFVVDPAEIVQCCREDIACWHAPPNQGSIGVELCDPQTGSAARWGDKNHTAMVKLAARLVADLCNRHDVPKFFVDGAALRAGAHGITTHHEVVQAWHRSDHTDPGPGFPMGQFIALVHEAAGAANRAPSTKEWDEMATRDEIKAVVKEVVDEAVAQLHAEHVLLLHGDKSHGNSIDSIAKAVKVPGA